MTPPPPAPVMLLSIAIMDSITPLLERATLQRRDITRAELENALSMHGLTIQGLGAAIRARHEQIGLPVLTHAVTTNG